MRRGAYYLTTYAEGKQRWLPLGRDYSAALHRFAQLERSEPAPLHDIAGLLSAYLADCALRLAPKTLRGYRPQAAALIDVFGDMRLDDLRRAEIARYMKLRGNVAANRERDLLRAAWNWALNAGITETVNPMAGMRLRNREGLRKARLGYVTDATLAALEAHSTPRMALLLRFLYLTGMRVGDALRIDLSAGAQAGIAWQMGKTRKPMLVSWSPRLRKVWLACAGNRQIGPLFISRLGRAYTLDGIESMFARVRRKAAVRDVTLHSLRRKAADDVPLAHAQALLGHSDGRVTQDHYRRKAQPVEPTR